MLQCGTDELKIEILSQWKLEAEFRKIIKLLKTIEKEKALLKARSMKSNQRLGPRPKGVLNF